MNFHHGFFERRQKGAHNLFLRTKKHLFGLRFQPLGLVISSQGFRTRPTQRPWSRRALRVYFLDFRGSEYVLEVVCTVRNFCNGDKRKTAICLQLLPFNCGASPCQVLGTLGRRRRPRGASLDAQWRAAHILPWSTSAPTACERIRAPVVASQAWGWSFPGNLDYPEGPRSWPSSAPSHTLRLSDDSADAASDLSSDACHAAIVSLAIL